MLIRSNTESCETIYNETCGFDKGEDICKNCETIYFDESQAVMDELTECGYDILDILEEESVNNNYDKYRDWWVKVEGRKTKQPDLTFVKYTESGAKSLC